MTQIRMKHVLFLITLIIAAPLAQAKDAVVYGVYTALKMGDEKEVAQKDYYISIGSRQGVSRGAKVKVYRKISTHDLIAKKLQTDIEFPIAEIKIIHVDEEASVGRLVRMLPPDETPAGSPGAILVGDRIALGGH